jgi:hypothetical protein
VTRALLISLPLVFLLGMAIQRGNTCTVVAIDDIVHRRSWDRFLASPRRGSWWPADWSCWAWPPVRR